MKVFGLYPGVSYAGGVVLIAANSLEEAQDLARKDEYLEFYGDWISNMKEVEELSANVNSPEIILNTWYIE